MAFQKRLEPLIREIGERGKPKPKPEGAVAEGVPPSVPVAPAPAPAPASSTPARAMVADHNYSLTPTMQMSPVRQQQDGMSFHASTADLASFLEKQREHDARVRQEMEAQLRPAQAISGEQLTALLARLERLHVAQLLTDAELIAFEVRPFVSCVVTNAERSSWLCSAHRPTGLVRGHHRAGVNCGEAQHGLGAYA